MVGPVLVKIKFELVIPVYLIRAQELFSKCTLKGFKIQAPSLQLKLIHVFYILLKLLKMLYVLKSNNQNSFGIKWKIWSKVKSSFKMNLMIKFSCMDIYKMFRLSISFVKKLNLQLRAVLVTTIIIWKTWILSLGVLLSLKTSNYKISWKSLIKMYQLMKVQKCEIYFFGKKLKS